VDSNDANSATTPNERHRRLVYTHQTSHYNRRSMMGCIAKADHRENRPRIFGALSTIGTENGRSQVQLVGLGKTARLLALGC